MTGTTTNSVYAIVSIFTWNKYHIEPSQTKNHTPSLKSLFVLYELKIHPVPANNKTTTKMIPTIENIPPMKPSTADAPKSNTASIVKRIKFVIIFVSFKLYYIIV